MGWEDDDQDAFGIRPVIDVEGSPSSFQDDYADEEFSCHSESERHSSPTPNLISPPPSSPTPEELVAALPVKLQYMHSIVSGCSSVPEINDPGMGADPEWVFPQDTIDFAHVSHDFLHVPAPDDLGDVEVDLSMLLLLSEEVLAEVAVEDTSNRILANKTNKASVKPPPLPSPKSSTVRLLDSDSRTSSKYLQDFSFAHQNGRGDILVDVPDTVASYDFFDPDVAPGDRLKGDYASKLPKALLMMLLGPINPPKAAFPLTADAKELTVTVMSKSIVEKTFASYGGCVLKFIKFCDSQSAPPEAVLPSNGDLVIAFLASLKGRRVDTISRYLCAIRFWNGLHSLKVDIQEKQWNIVQKGLKFYEPAAQVVRRELTISDLRIIIDGLDMSDAGDVAIKAALLFGFHSILRVAEFIVPFVDYFNEDENVSIVNVKVVSATKELPEHCIVHIPYDKTHQFAGRDTLIFPGAAQPELDPLAAFKEHLDVNRPPPKFGLFSYRTRDDPSVHRQLTKSFFIKRINKFLVAAGRPPISGHEIRIGGCTYYLMIGRKPEIVQMQGGWTSPAWFRYWRNIVTIAAKELNEMNLVSKTGHKVTKEVEEDDEPEEEEEEQVENSSKRTKASNKQKLNAPKATSSVPIASKSVPSLPSPIAPVPAPIVDRRIYEDDQLSEHSSDYEGTSYAKTRTQHPTLTKDHLVQRTFASNGTPTDEDPGVEALGSGRRRSARIQKSVRQE